MEDTKTIKKELYNRMCKIIIIHKDMVNKCFNDEKIMQSMNFLSRKVANLHRSEINRLFEELKNV